MLGSEVVYALTKTRVAEAIAVFEKLAATIAALLNDGGVCLIAYCPRSDVEAYFFDMLPKHGLRLRADNAPSAVASGYDGKGNGVPRGVPVADLGLARHQVDGLRLFAIERDAARETPADAAAAPPPPPTFAPIAFDFLRPPLDDPLD